MGAGNVRFVVRKAAVPTGSARPLPDPPVRKGSPFVDRPDVLRFAARIKRGTLHETEGPFDSEVLERRLVELTEILEAVV